MVQLVADTSPKKNQLTSMGTAMGMISIVLMMVIPVPPFLLDGLLAISLAIAVGVFLIALFIEKPLEYSVFPTVVLIATLLRLSLNVATTRLILLHGAEGSASAGKVIETFGRVVVGGDVLVGLVVFLILVIINFVVITKGAGRIAEVAARFTLDAMPGKQMAIDADLNGGLITPDIAKTRRREVEREADFFGAMDGASKFVHGDAIAGIIITIVNLVGGLIRGMSQGMDLSKAMETFSILSVGDALVAQIPALLISTASGIFVTRTATGEQLGDAIVGQMFGNRRAVGLTASVLVLFSLIPGMPAMPFLTVAGLLGYVVYSGRNNEKKEAEAEAEAPPPPAGRSDDVEAALPLDVLALEVGYDLIPAVDAAMGGTLLSRIGATRQQFATDLGVIMPPVRIRDNLSLKSSQYRYMLLGTEIAGGELKTGRLLAMSSPDQPLEIDGEQTTDPIFGTPALWITPADRELAEAFGATCVDHATVLATHLAEVVRQSADQLVGRAELQQLLDVFSRATPKLVEDLIPAILPLGDVHKVMRNLLRENVSIRDLRTILELLCEAGIATKDAEQLTEMVRQRMSRQLTAQYKDAVEGILQPMVLDGAAEEMFRRSLRDIASGTGGALDPEEVRRLGASLEAATQRQRNFGRNPFIITSPELRRYVRAFVERRVPQVAVLSFREIDGSATIRPVETISAR